MSRRNSLMVSRTLYQIGVVTLLMALIWVGFGAYRALSNTKVENVDKSLLESVPAAIEVEVVNQLKTRLRVDDTIVVEEVVE